MASPVTVTYLCCSSYVDLQAQPLVVDVVSGFIILEAVRHSEENAQALPAGGAFRISVNSPRNIAGQLRWPPIIVQTMVNVDSSQATEYARTDTVILPPFRCLQGCGQRREGAGVGALRPAAGTRVVGDFCGLVRPWPGFIPPAAEKAAFSQFGGQIVCLHLIQSYVPPARLSLSRLHRPL